MNADDFLECWAVDDDRQIVRAMVCKTRPTFWQNLRAWRYHRPGGWWYCLTPEQQRFFVKTFRRWQKMAKKYGTIQTR